MKEEIVYIVVLIILMIFITGCTNVVESQKTTYQVEQPTTNLNNCQSEFPINKSSNGPIIIPSVIEWAEFEQCGKNILTEYKKVTYCKTDSDCIYQQTDCVPISVNKYNQVEDYVQKVGDATGYYPHCYSRTLTYKFLAPYCEVNECKLKIDCSNCNKINDVLENAGCFQERPPVTVNCLDLAECNC